MGQLEEPHLAEARARLFAIRGDSRRSGGDEVGGWYSSIADPPRVLGGQQGLALEVSCRQGAYGHDAGRPRARIGRPCQRGEEPLCQTDRLHLAGRFGRRNSQNKNAAAWSPSKAAGLPASGSMDGVDKIRPEEASASESPLGHRFPRDRERDLRMEAAPPCNAASRDRGRISGHTAVSQVARPPGLGPSVEIENRMARHFLVAPSLYDTIGSLS